MSVRSRISHALHEVPLLLLDLTRQPDRVLLHLVEVVERPVGQEHEQALRRVGEPLHEVPQRRQQPRPPAELGGAAQVEPPALLGRVVAQHLDVRPLAARPVDHRRAAVGVQALGQERDEFTGQRLDGVLALAKEAPLQGVLVGVGVQLHRLAAVDHVLAHPAAPRVVAQHLGRHGADDAPAVGVLHRVARVQRHARLPPLALRVVQRQAHDETHEHPVGVVTDVDLAELGGHEVVRQLVAAVLHRSVPPSFPYQSNAGRAVAKPDLRCKRVRLPLV
jgi:hypothetical protein